MTRTERLRQGVRATGWMLVIFGVIGAKWGWDVRDGLWTPEGHVYHFGLTPMVSGFVMLVVGLGLVAWSFRRRR